VKQIHSFIELIDIVFLSENKAFDLKLIIVTSRYPAKLVSKFFDLFFITFGAASFWRTINIQITIEFAIYFRFFS